MKPRDYRRIDLRAHPLLAEVALHDVWSVDLPGGGVDRTIMDVRSLMSAESLVAINPVVRALFAFRSLLGQIFGWDSSAASPRPGSFLGRLSEQDRRRSLVEPGSPDGPFTVLYVHPFEAVSEIRNATVHAFSVLTLQPHDGGYRLFWAIYVQPIGRITAFYMALIDPFRRWLIYPAVLRYVHRSWRDRHPDSAGRPAAESERTRP